MMKMFGASVQVPTEDDGTKDDTALTEKTLSRHEDHDSSEADKVLNQDTKCKRWKRKMREGTSVRSDMSALSYSSSIGVPTVDEDDTVCPEDDNKCVKMVRTTKSRLQ